MIILRLLLIVIVAIVTTSVSLRLLGILCRYRALVHLARREGFGPFLTGAHRAERQIDGLGVRLRRVLEEAGGVYIKIGQIAATRVDLFPPEVCAERASLQNRVAPESPDEIRPMQVAKSVRRELDFRRETDAMEEMALLVRDRSPVLVTLDGTVRMLSPELSIVTREGST